MDVLGDASTSKTFDLVQLSEGSAEIFGAELKVGQRVNISGQNLAVFTWSGATVRVDGSPRLVYCADETPMVQYLNVHKILEARREATRESNGAMQGPRVVVLGPTDSGKTTLCRMLTNWAVRSGWEPTMVDLDVGQGSITVPGCVAATPVEAPIDIADGYPMDMPLVYFYGHASPGDNPELYKFLIERLAAVLERRAAASPSVAAAGLVVNTCGWIDGLGYDLQLHAIATLKVNIVDATPLRQQCILSTNDVSAPDLPMADVVIVMERDSLYSQLSSELKRDPSISAVKLAKSGGVVTRGKDERRFARDNRIKEYFYGTRTGLLAPVTNTARADDLKVWRIGGGPRAPTSALPIGIVSAADPLRLAAVPVNTELIMSLLAVSHATTPDQITTSNVAGFVLVKDVDIARGHVTYMAPCDGALPGRYLTAGSLKSMLD